MIVASNFLLVYHGTGHSWWCILVYSDGADLAQHLFPLGPTNSAWICGGLTQGRIVDTFAKPTVMSMNLKKCNIVSIFAKNNLCQVQRLRSVRLRSVIQSVNDDYRPSWVWNIRQMLQAVRQLMTNFYMIYTIVTQITKYIFDTRCHFPYLAVRCENWANVYMCCLQDIVLQSTCRKLKTSGKVSFIQLKLQNLLCTSHIFQVNRVVHM